MTTNNKNRIYVGADIPKRLYDKIEKYRASQSPIPAVADVLREALTFFLDRKEAER